MRDELEVMSKVAEMLESLDEKARSRVLTWVIGKLGVADVRHSANIAPLVGAESFNTAEPNARLSPEPNDFLTSEASDYLIDEQDYSV